jgi:WD40 repeat protein
MENYWPLQVRFYTKFKLNFILSKIFRTFYSFYQLGDESKIRIFDLATGQQLLDLKNHTASVKSLSWSMNSKKLLSGCSDGSFYVWNINNNLGLR